jgi:nitrogen fixation protein FixH
MSKHIRPVFAVTEATVALTVAETGVTAVKAVTDEGCWGIRTSHSNNCNRN